MTFSGVPLRVLISAGAILFIASSAPAQNLYVAGYYAPGTIYEFTPGGSPGTFHNGGLGEPEGIAFDSSGNLFVADSGSGRVDKITPGQPVTTFASVPDPNGLAFDSAGDLFVSGYNNGTIYKFTPGGSETTFLTGLSNPCTLAFDRAGDLFFMNEGNGSISECKNVGGTLSTSSTLFASGLTSPGGMAFNGAGNMFVGEASIGSGDVLEFTPTGSKSTFVTGLGGPLASLAFDSSGNLFGTESAPSDVVKITPTGSANNFATGLGDPTTLAIQGITLPVPEPSVWAMATVGGIALLLRRRKNK